MKQCKKDFWISTWGKVLFVLFHWGALIAGWYLFQSKVIAGNGDIADLTINAIPLLLLVFSPALVIFGTSLVSKKIQAGTDEQKSKDKAEIEKLKLEICKIKCERELVESKNRCLELQRKKQQSTSET